MVFSASNTQQRPRMQVSTVETTQATRLPTWEGKSQRKSMTQTDKAQKAVQAATYMMQ